MAELYSKARNVGQGSWSSSPSVGTPGGSGAEPTGPGGTDPQGIAGSQTQSGTVEFSTPSGGIKPAPENLTPYKPPDYKDLMHARNAYDEGSRKNSSLNVGQEQPSGPKVMQPNVVTGTIRPMQESSPSYGGAGEKGTGFENFQRYVDANKGAISKWQSEHEKASKEGLASAGNNVSQAESDFASAIEAPGTPDVSGSTPEEAATAGRRADSQKASDAARAALDEFRASHGDTPFKDWSQEDRVKLGELTRAAEKTVKYLGATPEHAPTDPKGALTKAADAEQQHRDTVAALDFYKSQSAQNITANANDVAKRTSELSVGEGMFGAMRERGETVGQATLGASLLGSGDAGRISSEATQGANALSDRLTALPGSIEATRNAELDASDARAKSYSDALEALQVKRQDELKRNKPSKSWGDYINPLESVLAGIANPRKNLARAGAPGWLGDVLDPAGWLMGTGDERGWEGKIVNTLSGGARHSAAAFRGDEEAVYNTFSDSELLALEKMDENEQRKAIDQRRQELGMA